MGVFDTISPQAPGKRTYTVGQGFAAGRQAPYDTSKFYPGGFLGDPNQPGGPKQFAKRPGAAAAANTAATNSFNTTAGAVGDAVRSTANTAQQQNYPYGSESGPGILEQWFNMRANGTDPGYEYAMNRGMNDIGSRMAAAGSFNSGATNQQRSDFAANMAAQREGQLDALAGGASGEHQGRLNAMIQQMLGLAGGQSGTMGAYDLGAAGAMGQGLQALLSMMAGKAGVDNQANQQFLNNLFKGASVYAAM